MPDQISAPRPAAPASGTVHWIGTGLSTGSSGLRLLCDQAKQVVLWSRSEARAVQRLAELGLAGRADAQALGPVRSILPGARRWASRLDAPAKHPGTTQYEGAPPARPAGREMGAPPGRRLGEPHADPTRSTGQAPGPDFDLETLAAALRPGDVLVSMLPAARHPELVRLCLARGAHFACSSYVSPELEQAAAGAARAGAVVLTEAGLDPGIDHLMAHRLVAAGRAALPDAVEADFTSYCGGVPAEPNAFRYRFSWAPQGVLSALRSPARRIADGVELTVSQPWEATSTLVLEGEPFEVYPNRDSLPFIAQYGFPAEWRLGTFVRGTLRLAGWRRAWGEVFDTLRAGDDARISALADELAARYPMTPADRDRVVLAVSLSLRTADGRDWTGRYLLDLVGDERESAMARCVSLPLAYGITRILAGAVPAGLHRAAHSQPETERWLAFLADSGITIDVQ